MFSLFLLFQFPITCFMFCEYCFLNVGRAMGGRNNWVKLPNDADRIPNDTENLNSFSAIVAVPICMPPDGADFTGKIATVSGWGRLKYGGGVPSVLQEVQVSTKKISTFSYTHEHKFHFYGVIKLQKIVKRCFPRKFKLHFVCMTSLQFSNAISNVVLFRSLAEIISKVVKNSC